MATPYEDIRGVGRPARDALARAGYPDLESLDGQDWAKMLGLHGVGKRGLERLQDALVERGLGMSNAPAKEERAAQFTEGHTGVNTDDYAGGLSGEDPVAYVDGLDMPRRVTHGRQLLEIFHRVTGAEPRMWGPSMIGYGAVHYRYASGREGDTFRVGFSPRTAKISLYGLPHDERFLSRLGKHTTGASCLYINKPEDVDLEVLEEMIRHGWENWDEGC
ncbi:DUF1801 domain-containing protein [Corynebacterium guangdongense]|uniref:YdhG-like domain-containing protein n=1 Tax=Corynebacterium guangdongense TaxID=1783348 RepID=A0ABU2A0L9_9CORY|nr:DUF1801 domain-containing protein [Corynebacterium guangdongense]MDR7330701.1 hypothetical protein [Corynebacterium guangdongense]WJZ16716.1 hypothetical protein CGUA_00535 [Corynebacterium guangdongense]